MNTSHQGERESAAPTQLENLLDENEYAQIRKCSIATVRRDRMLNQGCPYVKINALVRYRPQDIREFLERNMRGAVESNRRGGR